MNPSTGTALAELQTNNCTIPVFPLRDGYLFPNARLSLHIFEPRYRAMLADCLEANRIMVVVPLATAGGTDSFGRPRIAPMGCAGLIVEHHPLANGRANITLLGLSRVTLSEHAPVPGSDPARTYRVAETHVVSDAEHRASDADVASLLSAARMILSEARRTDPSIGLRLPEAVEPAYLADVAAAMFIPEAWSRQSVFEQLDPRERVRLVLRHLALAHSVTLARNGDSEGTLH